MVVVDKIIFEDENARRFLIGLGSATLLHLLFFIWISYAPSTKLMEAEIFSPPTSVSVRFITPKPVKENIVETKPIEKPVVKKVALKKATPEVLNRIEPAAAPPQKIEPVQQPAPNKMVKIAPPDAIPVISDKKLKGRRVQPQYPKRALQMKQEGVVWLRVLIGENGQRQDIKIQSPSQYALLNQAAIKAVKKWTFEPNIVGGRAVKSWVEIPIEFKIQ